MSVSTTNTTCRRLALHHQSDDKGHREPCTTLEELCDLCTSASTAFWTRLSASSEITNTPFSGQLPVTPIESSNISTLRSSSSFSSITRGISQLATSQVVGSPRPRDMSFVSTASPQQLPALLTTARHVIEHFAANKYCVACFHDGNTLVQHYPRDCPHTDWVTHSIALTQHRKRVVQFAPGTCCYTCWAPAPWCQVRRNADHEFDNILRGFGAIVSLHLWDKCVEHINKQFNLAMTTDMEQGQFFGSTNVERGLLRAAQVPGIGKCSMLLYGILCTIGDVFASALESD